MATQNRQCSTELPLIMNMRAIYMSLSEEQLDILHESLIVVKNNKDLATSVFYEKLFEIDPTLRRLFPPDLTEQADKALFAFGAVAAQIQNVGTLGDLTRDLAVRHVNYGVLPQHYTQVGGAVLATIEVVFGDDITPAVTDAWRKAYDLIATAMIAEAYADLSNLKAAG
ncbi:MAG: globin domain-containing protein [Bacteroidota bacterium]